MDNLELQIRYDTGESEIVRLKPRDILDYERKYDTTVGALSDGKYEHLCYLAWTATRRGGSAPKPFEDWVDTLDWITAVDDEADTTEEGGSPKDAEQAPAPAA